MTLTIALTGLDDYLDGGSGRIKALIMGVSGCGKTVHAAQWPKPLLADCEEGRMSVAKNRIPYAAIKSVADMKALLTLAEAENKRPADQRRFETLIIDTLDAYQRIVIQEYLKKNNKASMSGWQDWGHLDSEMNELVARLLGLSMHVVVNLHVKETKVGQDDGGDGGYLVKGPKLKGDLKEQIASEFDLVGYMETGWEAVDGKRALARYIQWAPSPDKPLAQDRSWSLPDRTPVTGTKEDFELLQRLMQAQMGELQRGSVVAEVEQPAEVEPEPVVAGGAVGTGAKPATKSAAAKKAAAAPKATPPATPAAPAVPAVTTPVPAVAAPVVEPKAVPVTKDEAVTAVEQVLGGEVIDPDAKPEQPKPEAKEDVETPVAAPDVVEQPAQQSEPAADSSPTLQQPLNGTAVVKCGTARYAGITPVDGCGTDLHLEIQEDRVTGCSSPEGQNPDLIQIGGLKFRTFLCNPCFANHRNAAKK